LSRLGFSVDEAKRAAMVEALKKPAGTLSGIKAQHVTPSRPQKPTPQPSFVRG